MRRASKILSIWFLLAAGLTFSAADLRAEGAACAASGEPQIASRQPAEAARRRPPKKKPKPKKPKKSVSKLSISAYCAKVEETFFPERLLEARCFSPLSEQFGRTLFELVSSLSESLFGDAPIPQLPKLEPGCRAALADCVDENDFSRAQDCGAADFNASVRSCEAEVARLDSCFAGVERQIKDAMRPLSEIDLCGLMSDLDGYFASIAGKTPSTVFAPGSAENRALTSLIAKFQQQLASSIETAVAGLDLLHESPDPGACGGLSASCPGLLEAARPLDF